MAKDEARARIQKLLVTGDNRLKQGVEPNKVRQTYEEALVVAREAGMGGLGFTPHSQGGTHIVERNLTRLTVVVATVFGLNTVLLFHLL